VLPALLIGTMNGSLMRVVTAVAVGGG